MTRPRVARFAALLLLTVSSSTFPIDAVQLADAQQQALYDRLIRETRCGECKNQSLAESTEVMAGDLRVEIADLVKAGMTESEIKALLVKRRGDSVLYRPRFRLATALLWILPGLLMAAGIWGYMRIIVSRARLLTDAANCTNPVRSE